VDRFVAIHYLYTAKTSGSVNEMLCHQSLGKGWRTMANFVIAHFPPPPQRVDEWFQHLYIENEIDPP
jgi:hypothetical protein